MIIARHAITDFGSGVLVYDLDYVKKLCEEMKGHVNDIVKRLHAKEINVEFPLYRAAFASMYDISRTPSGYLFHATKESPFETVDSEEAFQKIIEEADSYVDIAFIGTYNYNIVLLKAYNKRIGKAKINITGEVYENA